MVENLLRPFRPAGSLARPYNRPDQTRQFSCHTIWHALMLVNNPPASSTGLDPFVDIGSAMQVITASAPPLDTGRGLHWTKKLGGRNLKEYLHLCCIQSPVLFVTLFSVKQPTIFCKCNVNSLRISVNYNQGSKTPQRPPAPWKDDIQLWNDLDLSWCSDGD